MKEKEGEENTEKNRERTERKNMSILLCVQG